MATRYFRSLSILTDYTQAEEDTYAATLTGQSAGILIYNTTVDNARVWNGSAFITYPEIAASNLPLATTTLKGVIPATGTPAGKYLKDDLTWATVAAGGDMTLASAQTNSGVKTFLDTTMKLRNVANTFDGYFVNTNTANRVYTLKDATGTLAFTSDITGTNSGTNTGDQVISDATITTTDITTNNFTISKHGFVPKGTNVGNFLKDDGTWAAVTGGSGLTQAQVQNLMTLGLNI